MLDTGNGVIELFANAEPGRRPGQVDQTVPIKGLRQLTIPMASLPEQQEIVAILDRLLGREVLGELGSLVRQRIAAFYYVT